MSVAELSPAESIDPPFRHGARERGLARLAYQTLEPLHLTAYFAPRVITTQKELGMSFKGRYFGMRAAPLWTSDSGVVAASFYNFNPVTVRAGWDEAHEKSDYASITAARTAIIDETLREAFADGPDQGCLAEVVARFREVLATADTMGRTLSTAWMNEPWPDEPHLGIWHVSSLLREWRGDGHIAALVVAGLTPVEAIVFHEADHPAGSTAKLTRMGRRDTQLSRKWDDDAWSAAAQSLAARGLLVTAEDRQTLTEEGLRLFRWIEGRTDDAAASIWEGVADAESLLADVRPYVKAVITMGFLPGTART